MYPACKYYLYVSFPTPFVFVYNGNTLNTTGPLCFSAPIIYILYPGDHFLSAHTNVSHSFLVFPLYIVDYNWPVFVSQLCDSVQVSVSAFSPKHWELQHLLEELDSICSVYTVPGTRWCSLISPGVSLLWWAPHGTWPFTVDTVGLWNQIDTSSNPALRFLVTETWYFMWSRGWGTHITLLGQFPSNGYLGSFQSL